jgi:hypothetical protein
MSELTKDWQYPFLEVTRQSKEVGDTLRQREGWKWNKAETAFTVDGDWHRWCFAPYKERDMTLEETEQAVAEERAFLDANSIPYKFAQGSPLEGGCE